jgi:hypothetical protein
MADRGVTITDRDHGYRALMSRVLSLKSSPPSVAIGILARDASTPDSANTVLDVGTWQEFGTVGPDGKPRIPARSFIRAWADENQKRARKLLAGLMKRVIAGTLTEEQALEQFGLWAKGSIQERMARGVPPPNAQSTVDRKGSSTPLIDTGVLRSSIDFEIRR